MALGRPRAVEHHPLHVPGAAPGVARAAGTAINAGGIQMGAWGVQAFENDDAMDFAADLVDADSLDVVATSFEAIVPGEYLEAPDCCIALAAAEVVAALRGSTGTSLPQDVSAWARSTALRPDDALLDAARQAVGRIGERSELKELWQDSDHFDVWMQAVRDLETRLGAA